MDKSNALVRGSLSDIANRSNQSIAESFLSADVVVLIDVSASMAERDARDGRQRHEVACEELAALQADRPGKIAVIGFSGQPEFAPNGRPRFQEGNTNLAGALQFAKVADTGGVRFIIISDGQPDSESEALSAAAKYRSRIDCVFVGPENDTHARAFLDKLAAAHGGQQVTTKVNLLAEKIETLLLTA